MQRTTAGPVRECEQAQDKLGKADAERLYLEEAGIQLETKTPWPMLGRIDR